MLPGDRERQSTADWYQADYYATCTVDCRFPRGPTEDTGLKVIRGGGYNDSAEALRAADRSSADPASSSAQVACAAWEAQGRPGERDKDFNCANAADKRDWGGPFCRQ